MVSDTGRKGRIAYISVGSNLGEREQNCQKGIDALIARKGTRLLARSPFYWTEPVDYRDQDWFINAVIKIETECDPFELLAQLKAIQQAAGRIRDEIRFGPRILDLDILLYADSVIESPLLTIPHPRMHKRRFVLIPICDIDSNIIHPVLKQDMQTLRDSLPDEDQKVVRYRCGLSS